MKRLWDKSRVSVWLPCVLTLLLCGKAQGVVQYGDVKATAKASSQILMQHDGIDDDWEAVQHRNVFQGTLEYQFARNYSLFGDRFSIPFLESGSAYLLYRFSYDTAFDFRDRYRRHFEGFLKSHMRMENWLREVYADLSFGKVGPGRLSFRLGRQQSVWGEADAFRSLDIINPLDLRKTFLLGAELPDLQDIRIPLWALKGLYAWHNLGPIANPAIEVVWIPTDFRPLEAYAGGIFRIPPFGLPGSEATRSPLLPFRRTRHPFEISRLGFGRSDAPLEGGLPEDPEELAGLLAIVEQINNLPPGTLTDMAPDLAGQNIDIFWNIIKERRRGGLDDGSAGIRFLGQLYSVDFTLNYWYGFNEIPSVRGAYFEALTTFPGIPFDKGIIPGSLYGTGAPLTVHVPVFVTWARRHIIGGTLTYQDFKWTGGIFRTEFSHSTKEPSTIYPPLLGKRKGDINDRDFATGSRAFSDVTRLMFGFDKFGSYRWTDPIIGRGKSIFLSGQLFLEYEHNIAGRIGTLLAANDRRNRWNPLFTLLAQTWTMGGRLVPLLFGAYEVDTKILVLAPSFQYYWNDRLSFRAGQIWFIGSQFRDSLRFLNRFVDRDQTFFRVQVEL